MHMLPSPPLGSQSPTPSACPAQTPSTSNGLRRYRPDWLLQPLSWQHRRALAGYGTELIDCANALGGHAAATEPEFLALGGDLRTLYELATALAQAVDEATARLHTDLTANRIAGADGAVAQALESVNGSIASIDGMLARLRTMTDGLQSMKPQMDRIGRVGILLQSVAVGFAVESSRTKECQQAFGSFVDEIRGLSKRTREIENRISEELDLASNKETAALRNLEQELTSLRELSRQLELTSSRTATEVQDRMNDIVAAMAAMRECSQLIQHHTEDAVFHMQFGDIVRQKIEHTVDAIREAASELSSRQPPVRSAASAHRTLAVQGGQLEMVETELATAQRQLGQAFSRISESSASLVAPAHQSEHGGPVGLKTLLEDLEQLQQLVTQGSQLRHRAGESGGQAFATAERIASQIREVQSINREMHLLALNAIVKTAALGSTGATLGVLSMQVHALYLDADAAVREIDTLAQQLTGAQQQGEIAAVTGKQAGSDLLGILEQVRRAAGDYQATTNSLAERVVLNREQLDKATVRLGTLDTFSHQLCSLRERLGTVTSALGSRFGQALAQAQRANAPTDDARYTMQSEREVHQRIGGTLATAPAATAAAATPARPPQPSVAPAEPAKGVPAASDTPPASSPTPPPPAETSSLGDNVELF